MTSEGDEVITITRGYNFEVAHDEELGTFRLSIAEGRRLILQATPDIIRNLAFDLTRLFHRLRMNSVATSGHGETLVSPVLDGIAYAGSLQASVVLAVQSTDPIPAMQMSADVAERIGRSLLDAAAIVRASSDKPRQ